MSAFKTAYDAARQAKYAFPKTGGWKTVHQVAKELRIGHRAVPLALRPCITGPAPTIERKTFIVWRPKLRKAVRVSGYRVIRRK